MRDGRVDAGLLTPGPFSSSRNSFKAGYISSLIKKANGPSGDRYLDNGAATTEKREDGSNPSAAGRGRQTPLNLPDEELFQVVHVIRNYGLEGKERQE